MGITGVRVAVPAALTALQIDSILTAARRICLRDPIGSGVGRPTVKSPLNTLITWTDRGIEERWPSFGGTSASIWLAPLCFNLVFLIIDIPEKLDSQCYTSHF